MGSSFCIAMEFREPGIFEMVTAEMLCGLGREGTVVIQLIQTW